MRASDTTSASAPLERELFLFGLSHQLRTVVDRLFMKRQVVAGSFQNVPKTVPPLYSSLHGSDFPPSFPRLRDQRPTDRRTAQATMV